MVWNEPSTLLAASLLIAEITDLFVKQSVIVNLCRTILTWNLLAGATQMHGCFIWIEAEGCFTVVAKELTAWLAIEVHVQLPFLGVRLIGFSSEPLRVVECENSITAWIGAKPLVLGQALPLSLCSLPLSLLCFGSF